MSYQELNPGCNFEIMDILNDIDRSGLYGNAIPPHFDDSDDWDDFDWDDDWDDRG